MNVHRNARTTPYARALIVERHAAGEPVSAIASAFGISVRRVWSGQLTRGCDNGVLSLIKINYGLMRV